MCCVENPTGDWLIFAKSAETRRAGVPGTIAAMVPFSQAFNFPAATVPRRSWYCANLMRGSSRQRNFNAASAEIYSVEIQRRPSQGNWIEQLPTAAAAIILQLFVTFTRMRSMATPIIPSARKIATVAGASGTAVACGDRS
jgi:hypothetical protein